MKYYYIAADGSTAGPETLETLTALMANGTVTVATMVVPAGGEDWTPLARVLRFFYSDDAGATTGPVAFSELNRLNQIAALRSDSWVMEEGGTEWKALATVLEGGGVAPAAAPAPVMQLPRTATGAYRPPAGRTGAHPSAGGPYSPPSAATGKTVVRRRSTGGLKRGPFFGILAGLVVLLVGAWAISARNSMKELEKATEYSQLMGIVQNHFAVILYTLLGAMVAGLVAVALRIRNIGWSMLVLIVFSLPVILMIVLGMMKPGDNAVTGLLGTWVISIFVSLILFIPVGALPPAYQRHKRMDTAGWLIAMAIILVYAGIIVLGNYNRKEFEKELERRREKNREKSESVNTEKTAAKPDATGIDRRNAIG
ncbi:MAG TPA: GYF domain-containing protein [Verrucomicrobiales bacterium]|jgi:hypothetical protein|nr:GYF domain-containing protein [Verrucomicrobiales bacterium]